MRRFVRRLGETSPLPFRRMECDPGYEAQVDFGRGASVQDPAGKRRQSHVFRIVLSYSRKGYSQGVWRQTTDEFIRVMENSFWAFGGIPKTIVIDNLRAAVNKADWFDPDLNPKVEAFCKHYGTVILPTKPYRPRHKGKIESGIKYVRQNALKGHVFRSLQEQDQHLQNWERQVADQRIHGTTKQQVKHRFEQVERAALMALPSERFPFFHEAERKVHRDGHVEVDKAYYSVPPEYLGHHVWVRWDTRPPAGGCASSIGASSPSRSTPSCSPAVSAPNPSTWRRRRSPRSNEAPSSCSNARTRSAPRPANGLKPCSKSEACKAYASWSDSWP